MAATTFQGNKTFDITNPRDWYRFVSENNKISAPHVNDAWRRELETIRQDTPLNKGLRLTELSEFHSGYPRLRLKDEFPVTTNFIQRQASSLEDLSGICKGPSFIVNGDSKSTPGDKYRSARSHSVDLPRINRKPPVKRFLAENDHREETHKKMASNTPTAYQRHDAKHARLNNIGAITQNYALFQKVEASRNKCTDKNRQQKHGFPVGAKLKHTPWNTVVSQDNQKTKNDYSKQETDRFDLNKYVLQQKSTLKLRLLEFRQRNGEKWDISDDKPESTDRVYRNPQKHNSSKAVKPHRKSNGSSPITTDDGLSIDVIHVAPKCRYAVVSSNDTHDKEKKKNESSSISPRDTKSSPTEHRSRYFGRSQTEQPKVLNLALNKDCPKKRNPAFMQIADKQKISDKNVKFADDENLEQNTEYKTDAPRMKQLEVFSERGSNQNTNSNSHHKFDPRFYPPCYKYDRFCSLQSRRFGSFRVTHLLDSVSFPKRQDSPTDNDVEISFENGMVVIKSKYHTDKTNNNNSPKDCSRDDHVPHSDDSVIDIDGRYSEMAHTTSPVNEEGVADELTLNFDNRYPDLSDCIDIHKVPTSS